MADAGDAEADEDEDDEDDDEDEDIDEPWLDELSFASSGLVSGDSARNFFLEATSGEASLTGSSDELDGGGVSVGRDELGGGDEPVRCSVEPLVLGREVPGSRNSLTHSVVVHRSGS